MANELRPFGFRPVQTRNGTHWCGKTQKVIVLAADTNGYFVGDMLKFTGEQAISPIDGMYYEVVTLAAAADTRLAGAVTGVSTTDDVVTQYLGYRPASAQLSNITLEIPMDRDVMYLVQEDSDGGALPANSSQANVDFVFGAGDTATSTSGSLIDSSTVNTTDALPFRIMRYDRSLDNETGNFALWLVTINQDAYNNNTGL